MNALDRILGRETVDEATSDVVPAVAGARPRGVLRDAARRKRSRVVASIVGRLTEDDPEDRDNRDADGNEESLFPDDAEEVEDQRALAMPSLKGVDPVKDYKKDPDSAGGEELLTPRAALVAPDVTPEAETHISPTEVPGYGQGSSFTSAEAAQAPPEQPGKSAVDTLLGRRPVKPNSMVPPSQARPTPMPMELGAVTEEEAKAAILESAGQGMPDHKAGDGKSVFNNIRRFI